MSLNNYKLCCELLGHSLDVRSVCRGPEGGIISGSRDKTAKIWNFDGHSSFSEGSTLSDHTNFISAVLYLEEEKWICTASNDSTICLYIFGNISPFATLKGHTGTVCCLSRGFGAQTLLSGSWDKTARVWEISENMPPTSLELKGHDAAVWAVATVPNGRYVTGSADKNIFMWNTKGEKVLVIKGHNDCVRGLIGLPNNGLLSCGNDAVIKLWNEDGECIRDYHGHGNYIYGIALGPDGDKFVTCGEDSSIRLWSIEKGADGDALMIPAQSVWAVTFLVNGDIVSGSSDGVVRVFTADSNRATDEASQSAFIASVETRKAEQLKELGGVKVNDLPGPESLLQEGTEGQTRIVRHPNGKILCYQWGNNQWNCLGDVMGAAGGTQETSGKKLFEGREYDYVFSVDISDTEPPIKLPYNKGEDPWMAAQQFIHKNNLPQVYLDQVANFVIKNSENAGVTEGQAPGYIDPFTGGSRYVPGTDSRTAELDKRNVAAPANNSGANLDPFTGASSYSTTSTAPTQMDTTPVTKHFPFATFQTLDGCDPAKVLTKLKEFNTKIDSNNLSNEILDNVIQLAYPEPPADVANILTLKTLLLWSKEYLFPVLDITRLAVRHQNICSKLGTIEFITLLVENIAIPPANQLMAIRCLANQLTHGWGRGLVESQLPRVLSGINAVKKGSANLEIAIATLLLNLTISQMDLADAESCKAITESIIEFIAWANDGEATYRALQAIGNLSCTAAGPVTLAQVSSVPIVASKILSYASTRGNPKLSEVARDLSDLMT